MANVSTTAAELRVGNPRWKALQQQKHQPSSRLKLKAISKSNNNITEESGKQLKALLKMWYVRYHPQLCLLNSCINTPNNECFGSCGGALSDLVE